MSGWFWAEQSWNKNKPFISNFVLLLFAGRQMRQWNTTGNMTKQDMDLPVTPSTRFEAVISNKLSIFSRFGAVVFKQSAQTVIRILTNWNYENAVWVEVIAWQSNTDVLRSITQYLSRKSIVLLLALQSFFWPVTDWKKLHYFHLNSCSYGMSQIRKCCVISSLNHSYGVSRSRKKCCVTDKAA